MPKKNISRFEGKLGLDETEVGQAKKNIPIQDSMGVVNIWSTYCPSCFIFPTSSHKTPWTIERVHLPENNGTQCRSKRCQCGHQYDEITNPPLPLIEIPAWPECSG